jgi:hypothetical protein
LVEEKESICDLDVLATEMDTTIMATKETSDEKENAMSAFVGSAVTLGRAEDLIMAAPRMVSHTTTQAHGRFDGFESWSHYWAWWQIINIE